jgi:hypothetical protein
MDHRKTSQAIRRIKLSFRYKGATPLWRAAFMDSLRAILIETNYNYCFCTVELERIYSAELIIDFDPEARAKAARFVD